MCGPILLFVCCLALLLTGHLPSITPQPGILRLLSLPSTTHNTPCGGNPPILFEHEGSLTTWSHDHSLTYHLHQQGSPKKSYPTTQWHHFVQGWNSPMAPNHSENTATAHKHNISGTYHNSHHSCTLLYVLEVIACSVCNINSSYLWDFQCFGFFLLILHLPFNLVMRFTAWNKQEILLYS